MSSFTLTITCAPALCGHKVEEGWDDVGVVVGGVAGTEVEQEVDPGEVNIAQTWTVVTGSGEDDLMLYTYNHLLILG